MKSELINKLLRIITHFGVNKQQRKLQEELFELQEVITLREQEEYNNSYTDQLEKDITEEIADVMVMLKQFQYYYEITDYDIEKVMLEKIDRTIKRIEEE